MTPTPRPARMSCKIHGSMPFVLPVPGCPTIRMWVARSWLVKKPVSGGFFT